MRRGNFSEVLARQGVYAFVRGVGEDKILVVINGSDQAKTFALTIGERAWKEEELHDLVAGGIAKPAGVERPHRSQGIRCQDHGAYAESRSSKFGSRIYCTNVDNQPINGLN